MVFNKFLETAGTGANLSDGSVTIVAKTLSAVNLDPSQTLKTNTTGTIISANLDIADTTGLQVALDSKLGTPLSVDLDVNKNDLDNVNFLNLCETGAGTNIISLQAPTTLTGPLAFVLPDNDGTNLDFLQTDGDGNTDWVNITPGDVSASINFTDDNRLLRSDTISGVKNIQQSALTLSDNGDISSSSTLQISSSVDAANAVSVLVHGGLSSSISMLNVSSNLDDGILIHGVNSGVQLSSTNNQISLLSGSTSIESIHLLASGESNSSIVIESTNSNSASAIHLLGTGTSGVRTSTEGGQNSMVTSGSSGDAIIINNSNATTGGLIISASGTSSSMALISNNSTANDALIAIIPLGGIQLNAGKKILLDSSQVSSTAIHLQGTGIGSGIKLESFSENITLDATGSSSNITLDSLSNGGIALTHTGNLGTGIQLDSGGVVGLTAVGNITLGGLEVDIPHTAAANDEDALILNVNAGGFGDVKALDISYITGAIAAGDDEEGILINIDQSASTGGRVVGLEIVGTSTGSAEIDGMECGAGCHPILHQSGTFGDADTVLVIAVDQTTALSGGGAGNISVFVADNNTMTIGDAAKYSEIEYILDTVASGAGIGPTFEYSTGVGTWAAYSPGDGTNGMRNSGVIIWDLVDIPGWLVGTGTEFLIRITRTRNSLSTIPIADLVQIAATTEYTWDKDGLLTIADVTIVNGGELKLEETGGANTVSLKAPSMSSDYSITLPNVVGLNQQVIYNLGSGVTEWRNTNFPFMYIRGMQLTSTSVTTVTIAVGRARDDQDTKNIAFTSPQTAVITTTGAGGLQTSSSESADTWYSVNLISDSSGANPDDTLLIPDGTAFSESGYDLIRRVGWVRNNSSSNFYSQLSTSTGSDRTYIILEDIDFVLNAGTSITRAAVDFSEWFPPTCRYVYVGVTHSGTDDNDYVSLYPDASSYSADASPFQIKSHDSTSHGAPIWMPCDASQQIFYENSTATEATSINQVGYIDSI